MLSSKHFYLCTFFPLVINLESNLTLSPCNLFHKYICTYSGFGVHSGSIHACTGSVGQFLGYVTCTLLERKESTQPRPKTAFKSVCTLLQKVRLKLMCISQFSHGNMLHHPSTKTKTYWDSRSKSILHGLGELCISISSLRAFSIVFNICYYRLICTPSVCFVLLSLKACSPFYLAILYFVFLGTWIRCNLQYTICRATLNLPGSS